MGSNEVTIVVNGHEFKEVHGGNVCVVMYEEGKKPEWLNFVNHDEMKPICDLDSKSKIVYRKAMFKALVFNGKFYAPKEFESK